MQPLPVLKKLSVGSRYLDRARHESRHHARTVGTTDRARLNNMVAGIEQGKGTAGKLITDPALADEAQNSPGAGE